jgi:hypothetical protein
MLPPSGVRGAAPPRPGRPEGPPYRNSVAILWRKRFKYLCPEYLPQLSSPIMDNIFYNPFQKIPENKDGKRGTKIISPIILTIIDNIFYNPFHQNLPKIILSKR